MPRQIQVWLRRLPVIGGLGLCFCLFQNFSLDNEYRDIRLIAPQGKPEEPRSGYFPDQIKSTSIQGLGNEILKHNLTDEMKQFENRFEDWSGIELHGKTTSAQAPGVSTGGGRAPSSYKFRTGHLGRDKVGVSLENDFKFKCEFSALKQDMQVSLEQPLGANASFSVRHKTEDHASSVNFSYNW